MRALALRHPARRYRPTFLLQCVVLAASLGLVLAAVALVEGRPLSIAMVAVLLVAGWVAIELSLLPTLVERWALRRAGRHGVAPRSRWFVDVDAEERASRERSRREVDHNPTLW